MFRKFKIATKPLKHRDFSLCLNGIKSRRLICQDDNTLVQRRRVAPSAACVMTSLFRPLSPRSIPTRARTSPLVVDDLIISHSSELGFKYCFHFFILIVNPLRDLGWTIEMNGAVLRHGDDEIHVLPACGEKRAPFARAFA